MRRCEGIALRRCEGIALRGCACVALRGRTPVVVLGLAILGLAIWRAACVLAGPDVDTDAYAHHMIARAILADPHDLAVHWVWLPLFHYLQVPLVALGGTMNDVRWANVALSAAVPIVLFAYVRSTTRTGDQPMSADATALVAALLCAACPIGMQMGTTAQSEPLFALLALGIAISFERRRYPAAAAMLGAAVLIRYEAWAILATVSAVTIAAPSLDRIRRGGEHAAPERARRWLVVAVPAALILAWAVLRRPVDGRWFGFLAQTHEFASQAVVDAAGSRGVVGLAHDALYYPVYVAGRVLGPAVALAAFGIPRTWREQGARFVLVLAACLGFVSLTWVKRSSLGLDRHFVAIVPLYATLAAQGVRAIAGRLARWVIPRGSARIARITARAIASALSVGALGILVTMLGVWMTFWRSAIDHGWPEREALGAQLRSLPPAPTIFCDDATLEILSGLDRRRFDRHWVDDPRTWDLIQTTAQVDGVTYVATWRRKLVGHEAAGAIVFRATDGPDDATSGVAVMRVPPDASRVAR
jgi:hypothetical protein